MIEITIPNDTKLLIRHLVLDYNGTIAIDGELIPSVLPIIKKLSTSLQIHVVTADTHATVHDKIGMLPCTLHILGPDKQSEQKLSYIQKLDCSHVMAIGNGRNDKLMLESAALSIAVMQQEGAYQQTIGAADIVCASIEDGLQLLLHPKRLIATLRR